MASQAPKALGHRARMIIGHTEPDVGDRSGRRRASDGLFMFNPATLAWAELSDSMRGVLPPVWSCFPVR